MTVTGYLKKLHEKSGRSAKGRAWVLFSGLFEAADGKETWVSFGFEKPPIQEGKYYEVGVEEVDGRFNYVQGSGKEVSAPAAVQAASSAKGVSAGGGADRNSSIVYQSSRKDAIELVKLLLEEDALPITQATTKAATAKRFEEITAYVDKLTVQFFFDVGTLRLLDSVVDAGAETAAASGSADTGAGEEEDDE